MSRLPARVRFLAVSAIVVGFLGACHYSEYPPRIDMEFKPGAPVVSNGVEFVPDTDNNTKSAFSAPEVAEQIAFINATLREVQMSSVSPLTSSAANRRYSVFLGHRLFDADLESALDRIRVSSLVASAEWTVPPLEPAHPHPKPAYTCVPFKYDQAQIGECPESATPPPEKRKVQKRAEASCVPFNYNQAQINECPEEDGK